MEFWIAAVVLSALVGGLMLLGVLRSQLSTADGAEDVRVYRDQLREVDRDLARGILAEGDAERLRLEISRRILDADRNPARGGVAVAAPRLAIWVAVATVPLMIGASFWLYSILGAPGYPDMPLAARLDAAAEERANRMPQAQAEAAMRDADGMPNLAAPAQDGEGAALVARLREVLQDRPDDLQGHRLLASSEASLGNFAAAHTAQGRVIAILGAGATADDHVLHADLMIRAADGYVSPEAEAALERALRIDPRAPMARFFMGLMMAQTGRPDVTFHLWRQLLNESPPDAPWVAPIRARIEWMAALAGVDYALPPAGSAPMGRGPSEADLAAAQEMDPEEREAMIRGMVSGLSARLSSQGGTADDWARLITALGVLGETEEASAIWTEAQVVFGAAPEDLALVLEAARDAGVAP